VRSAFGVRRREKRIGVSAEGRVGVGPPAFFNRYRARSRYRARRSVRWAQVGSSDRGFPRCPALRVTSCVGLSTVFRVF
jgi:hypothetical protein